MDGESPSLEERVAALEEMALAQPVAPEMTEEQAREFGREWQKALSEDEVRQLLRECVTVIKPGETLIIRGDRNWTPNQVREVQDSLDHMAEWRDLGFKVLVVPGEELGAAGVPDDALLRDCRVECFRDGASERWRVTHLPTGRVHHGGTRDGAIENLKIGLEYFGSAPQPASGVAGHE